MSVKFIALYFVFVLLALVIPGKLLKPIVYYNLPNNSILGEDKTLPPTVKVTNTIPTEVDNNRINVQVNAEAESKVLVYLNDKLVDTVETKDLSKFNFDLKLNQKENYFWFVAIDKNGNIGNPSSKYPVILNSFSN